jgi:hypothetical protein
MPANLIALARFLGFSDGELAEIGAMSRMKLRFGDGFCLTFRAHFLLS